MDLSLPIAAAIGGLIVWKWWSGRRSPEQLEAVQAALAAGAPLIDVRTPAEFSAGHLPGARNIPLSRSGGAAGLGDTIVVYCASGARSARAASALRAAGVGAVFDLGPMRNGAGLPAAAQGGAPQGS